MNQLFTDVRSGVRMLVKYPTLSIVAVLTLGLGIGLSTTVFCVVNGGMFKGLPFPDSDRIVAVVSTNGSQNQPRQPISVQDFAVWERRQTSFSKMGAYGFAPMNLSNEEGRPERYSGDSSRSRHSKPLVCNQSSAGACAMETTGPGRSPSCCSVTGCGATALAVRLASSARPSGRALSSERSLA